MKGLGGFHGLGDLHVPAKPSYSSILLPNNKTYLRVSLIRITTIDTIINKCTGPPLALLRKPATRVYFGTMLGLLLIVIGCCWPLVGSARPSCRSPPQMAMSVTATSILSPVSLQGVKQKIPALNRSSIQLMSGQRLRAPRPEIRLVFAHLAHRVSPMTVGETSDEKSSSLQACNAEGGASG